MSQLRLKKDFNLDKVKKKKKGFTVGSNHRDAEGAQRVTF